MQIRIIAMAIAAVASLSACGSSKDASKASFANAIDAYYAKNCTTLDFPMSTHLFAKFTDGGYPVGVLNAKEAGQPEKNLDAPFEALEKAGLLTSKPADVAVGFTGQKMPGKEYSLTDAGTKALAKPGRSAFCIGHRKVDDVAQFSEPSSGFGQTVSQAKYTYTVADLPAWAKDASVMAAFPDLAEVLKQKREGRADLVLMNDGWEAQPAAF